MDSAFPYAALGFDCYGTLVDWRAGMTQALAALPSLAGRSEAHGALLEARMRAEQRLEAGGWLPYREVLARSVEEACRAVLGRPLPDAEAQAFANAQTRWPAFPDSVAALRRLAPHVRLCLYSNSDRTALETTAATVLEGTVEALVCAEDVRSYKPAPAHFTRALELLGLPAARVLHVSAYPYYDLEPAAALGFATAFVARDPTVGPPEGIPLAASTRDLAGLAEALGV